MPVSLPEIHDQKQHEYDHIKEELLADEGGSFMIEEERDVLTSRDAIRILETLNIGKE